MKSVMAILSFNDKPRSQKDGGRIIESVFVVYHCQQQQS